MRDRSAVSTLKGYFYQFDFTILQLLKLDSNADKITVEGIEDVDISRIDSKTAIQCKYYENTEYNHSEIAEAVKYLLMDFAERKNENIPKIKYMLYGYYLKGQDKLPDIIDVQFLKAKFLTHRRKKKDVNEFEIIKEYETMCLNDEDLEEFLKLLKIDIYAKEFEQQMQDIFKQIIDIFKCTLFEAEHYYYYYNALKIIKSIAICESSSKREISKGEFLKGINRREILFNQWFYVFRTQKEIFNKIRKEYFTHLNISPYERFFLIDIGASEYDLVTIKDLIYLLIKKWSKCSKREKQPFCPYIYFHNISREQLLEIKKELFREKVVFVDGFPFYMSDFYSDILTLPTTLENKIEIKFINEVHMLNEIIAKIYQKVEIYQFYQNEIFYETLNNVKHVKIQIEKINNIKEII